jgi:hypothetical protein
MTEQKDVVNIRKLDGKRSAKYYAADLSGGRQMIISRRTRADRRVWLSNADEWLLANVYGIAGPGGIGRIDNLLDEWRERAAIDPEAAEFWRALRWLDMQPRDDEAAWGRERR